MNKKLHKVSKPSVFFDDIIIKFWVNSGWESWGGGYGWYLLQAVP
jgi:hypothetical protein